MPDQEANNCAGKGESIGISIRAAEFAPLAWADGYRRGIRDVLIIFAFAFAVLAWLGSPGEKG